MRSTLSIIIVCLINVLTVSIVSAGKLQDKLTFAQAYWPPMISKSATGESEGLYAEILQEILKIDMSQEGVLPPLEHRELPWKRAQLEIEQGFSDFFITTPTEERLQYSILGTEPFHLVYLYVYTYSDHPKINQIREIKTVEDIKKLGLTSITYMGNGWHKSNIEAAGVKTLHVTADKSAAAFLAKKRADIMIDDPIATNLIIRKSGLAPQITMTAVRFGPIKLHLMMSKKSHHLELLPVFDRALREMQENGMMDQLVKKHITP